MSASPGRKPSSDRQILKGFGAAFLFLLIAKMIGAGKEVVIAYHYGTGTAADAYALGFAVANWPVALSGMCANMLLIPLFVAHRKAAEEGAEAAAASDTGAVTLWAMLVSGLLAIGVFFLLRDGGALLGLSAEAAAAVALQAPGIALMIPPGVMATILAARLMAHQRQIPSLYEAIPSIVLIVGVLAFGDVLAANPLLAWCTSLGFCGYVFALLLADRRVLGDLRPQALRLVWPTRARGREIALILLAQICFSFGGVLMDQLAAASLASEENATLAYANRLLMLATTLGATAIGRAVLPVLAAARLEGEGSEYALTRRWSLYMFLAGVACAVLGYVLAPFGVRILFEHGSFTAEDTAAVSETLRAGLLRLPFYFVSLILAQSVVVQRRFGLLLLANVLAVCSKLLLLKFFLDVGGLNLIMYATVLMYAVSLLVLSRGLIPSWSERKPTP